jgi:hypothetical protein
MEKEVEKEVKKEMGLNWRWGERRTLEIGRGKCERT